MHTVAILNQKGGCGKTTTAINLAAVLSRAGLRTLLIDLDPQAHCAAGLAVPESQIELHIGDAILAGPAGVPTERLLWPIRKKLHLAPSTVQLAGLESHRGGLSGRPAPDASLTNVLEPLKSGFDWCVIDCPPSIGLLTYNGLRAADEVLIPVEPAFLSMHGAGRQVAAIRAYAARLGRPIPHSVAATMYDPMSPLAKDSLHTLRQQFGDGLAPAAIRLDPAVREAVSCGQPVVEYAPDAPSAEDYTALAGWLLDPERRAAQSANAAFPSIEEDPSSLQPYASVFQHEDPPSAASKAEPTQPAHSAGPASQILDRAAELAMCAKRLTQRGAAMQDRLRTDVRIQRTETLSKAPRPTRPMDRIFGVRPTVSGVLFVQPCDAGSELCIAGGFNDWSATATPLRHNPRLGIHEACVRLPPGKHEYRLVVDGSWTADPFNLRTTDNPYGDRNNIVVVPPRRPAQGDRNGAHA